MVTYMVTWLHIRSRSLGYARIWERKLAGKREKKLIWWAKPKPTSSHVLSPIHVHPHPSSLIYAHSLTHSLACEHTLTLMNTHAHEHSLERFCLILTRKTRIKSSGELAMTKS